MPEVLTAPAPSAPTPAPTPSPSPSPRPSPTPSQDKPQPSAVSKSEISPDTDVGAEMDSAFDRMEKRYAQEKPDKPSEEKEKKAEPAPAGDKPKAQPATSKAETKPATTEKKDADPDAKAPKWYRERLEAINGELEELRSSKVSLEAKGKDTTALTAQLEAERKEKEAAFGKIRRLTKEHDPAFKEKWQKPYEQACDYAESLVERLHVGSVVEDPETGSSRWKPERKASWKADFGKLYHLHRDNPTEAYEQAEQMFGKAAPLVINQIQTIEQLDRNLQLAKTEEESKWKENESKEIADQALYNENLSKAASKARQEIIDETLWLYGETPDDPEANKLLKEGFEYLDYKPKTFNEAVRALERNKLNAGVVPKLRYLLEKALAENAELKAAKEERNDSGPGKTKRDTAYQPSSGDDVTSESLLSEMKEAMHA